MVLLELIDKAILLLQFLVFLLDVIAFLLDFIFEVEILFFVLLKLHLEVLDFGVFLTSTLEIAISLSLSFLGLLGGGKVGGRGHLLNFIQLFIEDALTRILFVGFGLIGY